jgi:hypothetical protein
MRSPAWLSGWYPDPCGCEQRNVRLPCFEKEPASTLLRRRLLLISYHFAPSTAVGALRWQKLGQLLAEAGWGMDVISAYPESGSTIDPAVAADLPAGIRIWQVPSPEPLFQWPEKAVARIKRRLSGTRSHDPNRLDKGRAERATGIRSSDISWNLLSGRTYFRFYFTLRDLFAGREWSRRIRRVGLQVIAGAHRSNGLSYSVIVTSGPPHAWHNAGAELSRRTGIPLVLDLRDPWSAAHTVHEYFATPLWLNNARRQERRVVEQADLIVANTRALQAVTAAHHPDAAARMITVMNGWDEDPVDVSLPEGARFRIGYAGVVYLGRDPRPLFRGLARAVHRLELQPQDLEVEFVGDVDQYGGMPMTEVARECGVAAFLKLRGRVDRRAALRFMSNCHMLVSLPWGDTMSVPAKIFEYMRFRAWLLVFAEQGSALADLLHGTGADVVDPRDEVAIEAAIVKRYQEFRGGEAPPPFAGIERFGRRYQAQLLIQALEETLAGRTESPAGRSAI